MVSYSEPVAVGFCCSSRKRWTGIFASIPGNETWICQRNLSICCHGVPEISCSNMSRDSDSRDYRWNSRCHKTLCAVKMPIDEIINKSMMS
jgi:hypothetical protein